MMTSVISIQSIVWCVLIYAKFALIGYRNPDMWAPAEIFAGGGGERPPPPHGDKKGPPHREKSSRKAPHGEKRPPPP